LQLVKHVKRSVDDARKAVGGGELVAEAAIDVGVARTRLIGCYY
jgi:hypothetical protein